ncbi:hypothetical protein [Methylomonas sp. HYX-M1]|uniref:hypothetical protein n=1 Tax=Methylomonas sp. HYX-M1 TaxID=3139307 RepID=UPI00345C1C71
MRFIRRTAVRLTALIKKESLQRDIEAMEREKQQRLGQDAAATDQGPSAADSPVGKVKTLTVNRGLGQSMRM